MSPLQERRSFSLKDLFWSSLFLVTSLVLAVFSSTARGQGQYHAAAFLAVFSLLLASIVCLTLLPRILRRLRLDWFSGIDSFHLTRRGGFFILIILVIGFSTFNTGNNLLILVLSFLLAALVTSAVVSNLVLQGLKISMSIPETIHVGQRATFFLTLHNLKRLFPSVALRLKGQRKEGGQPSATDFFSQEKHYPFVRAGEKLQLNLVCEFDRRGIFPVDGFEVVTTFPFGFFTRGRKLDAAGHIVVYPRLLDRRGMARRFPVLFGEREHWQKGLGSSVHTIRDYQDGDHARFVHWKATARTQHLMVRDFAREERLPAKLLFSTFLPERSIVQLEKFELAVSYVASLVYFYRASGTRLDFDSGEFSASVNGRREDYEKLMEYLAQVQPSETQRLKPGRVLGPALMVVAGEAFDLKGADVVDFLRF